MYRKILKNWHLLCFWNVTFFETVFPSPSYVAMFGGPPGGLAQPLLPAPPPPGSGKKTLLGNYPPPPNSGNVSPLSVYMSCDLSCDFLQYPPQPPPVNYSQPQQHQQHYQGTHSYTQYRTSVRAPEFIS